MKQLVVAALLALAIAWPGGTAAAPNDANDLCKDGGWQTLLDDHGQPFKNQGQCVSFAARGGIFTLSVDPSQTGIVWGD